MLYCFALRKYPSVRIFFVSVASCRCLVPPSGKDPDKTNMFRQYDHRNDIVVNSFGLVMSIVGDRFVWYLDPLGAIMIALLILFSWVSNAFEQVWLLVGKSAPKEFISKLIYMTMTHDPQILKVDTVSCSPPPLHPGLPCWL